MPAYNEMLNNNDSVRRPYGKVAKWIDSMHGNIFEEKHNEAKDLLKRIGITFSIYKQNDLNERLIPFDMVPRIFTSKEWDILEKGVIQRTKAINLFINDIYNSGEILKDKIIPPELIYKNKAYEPSMIGFTPPKKIFSHITGSDIVRTSNNSFMILEDNCRTPSGVSYMMQNREIMMRMFPSLFLENSISPIDDYPIFLRNMLSSVAPKKCNNNEPVIVILTPGSYNSAYYEHSFLADLMGIELVEGRDLFVEKDIVYMRTVRGRQKVDVLYRRIDDQYLDPLFFDRNSIIGVPGIMSAYRNGNITICNAPGSGIADDKAIYTYVPDMIKFYLGEKPILKNVKTWKCGNSQDLKFVKENIKDLVIKEVHGSGGYGMLIGQYSTKNQINLFLKKILKNPENFIAQPTLSLSTCPTYIKNSLEQRHVDFRPFCLQGDSIKICKGGLTRVALKENSLIVNSSQGGGVKDTWILQPKDNYAK